jgi:AraC-like DNA-binding protein
VNYREAAVPDSLRPFVSALWTLSSDGRRAPKDAGTILPDGSVELVVSRGGGVRRRPRGRRLVRFVVGQMERPWRLSYDGAVDLAGVRLHPAAGRSVLRRSQQPLVGRIVAMSEIASELDRLLSGPDTVLDALATHLAEASRPDPVLVAVIGDIRRSRGMARIADVCRTHALAPRQLERRFRADVGLSPKRWARIIRFQSVLEEIAGAGPRGWADLAHRYGHADQAHFTREFTEFTGRPPTAWWH